MKLNKNFMIAASLASLLTVAAPFQRVSAQNKQGATPAPAKTEQVTTNAYASNDKKPSAIFASNSNSVSKGANNTGTPLSAEDMAREYSKGGKGLGFVVSLGALDKNLSDTAAINKFERLFKKYQVNAKVFLERNEYEGSGYYAYLNGTDFYGTMYNQDLKKNLPDIIASQKSFEARNENRLALEKH